MRKTVLFFIAAFVLAGCAHFDGLNQVDIRHRLDKISNAQVRAMTGLWLSGIGGDNLKQIERIDALFSEDWSLCVVLLNSGDAGYRSLVNRLAGLMIQASIYSAKNRTVSDSFKQIGDDLLELWRETKQ